MQIEQFDPARDHEQARRCHDIVSACERTDDPAAPPRSLAAFTAWWSRGPADDPRQSWLATPGAGQPGSGCYLLLLPERENTAIAGCSLYVAPEARRASLGTQLLAHSVLQARQAGRSRLSCEVRDDSPGAAFAAAAGMTSGIAEVYRQLSVDASLQARLPALHAAAGQRSAGYSLISWTGLTPEEHMAGSMRLDAAMADAPRDDGVELELWDADRIWSFERTALESGQHFYSVAARHDQTGRLAAITQLRTDPGSPGWGFQAITAVLPADRGHRLGLLVKVAMLELLAEREPGLRRIVTGNAGGNDHMIAINEQLGFEIVSVSRRWELSLAAS